MDPDSTSLDYRDRAVSSEPASTRPNPFDDTDSSSRKRRRTSMSGSVSGSPAKSTDIINLITDSPSSGTLDGDATISENTEPTKIDTDSISPQTPEHLCASTDPPREPPPSMVTINLRKIPDDEPMSSPSSPTLRPKDLAPDSLPDEVRASVEAEGVEMVPTAAVSVDTPQSSSLHDESPPIELITVQSDDDMAEDINVSIIQEDAYGSRVDPLQHFPYKDNEEAPVATLSRLITYLTDNTNVEEQVVSSLQQWLSEYVNYINTIDLADAQQSFRQHRDFWLSFPDVVYTMLNRRPSILRLPALHKLAMDFFAAFARISAWLILLDLYTIQSPALMQKQERGPPVDLLSHLYLQQVHTLIQSRMYGQHMDENDSPSLRSDDVAYLLDEFHSARGGKLANLANLVSGVVKLLPLHPRLFDCLGSLCQFTSDIMYESSYSLRFPRQPDSQGGATAPRRRLQLGHNMHDLVLDALVMMIERHVTQLNSDSVSSCLRGLLDMLRASLQGDHPEASALLEQHQIATPSLLARYTIESMIWEEHFDLLVKLIRSSQMQLRVLAVTQMCNELVNHWKRYSEGAEEGAAVFLGHLADYLIRSNLVQYILGPNCHPEITAESGNIIGFLVVTKSYRKEHTDLLWQGIASSQDPRNVDSLNRLMSQIMNLFDYPSLLGFCKKLQTLPIESYTPVIRTIWDSVIRQIITKSTLDGIGLDFDPYDLCLRLLREASVCRPDSPVAYPELQRAALHKFSDLMNQKSDEEIREQVYMTCIEDIAQKSPTALGSLWGLSASLQSAAIPDLHILAGRYDLPKLVIEELEHAIETKKATGIDVFLAGAANRPRQEFIANIIQLEPLMIDGELGRKLWDILVGPESSCLADREAGWTILNAAMRNQPFLNPFNQCCLTQYLPALPPSCFCEGMLNFVRLAVIPRLDDLNDLPLDDEEAVAQSGIEQLWRLILEADDVALVEQSIGTLVDIYINSKHILSNPLHRNQQIHLALVNRCLRQLKDAARIIRGSIGGSVSDDDESMVIVTAQEQIRKQERVFARSLQLLRILLEKHRLRPQFAVSDLRTLIPDSPYQVEGDSAELKYQSFDGDCQTEVKPLKIGQSNTAASLLASIRDETGFANYRLYYRGGPLTPNEHSICKTLRDLCIQDGLILVRREEDKPIPTSLIKPGASLLEIEISAHFTELWGYLSMEERLAEEIYNFLIKLPTNGNVLEPTENGSVCYEAMFPSGQPYKSLYAIHAVAEHAEAIAKSRFGVTAGELAQPRKLQVIKEHMGLIVQAISDQNVVDQASPPLGLQVMNSLIRTLYQLINHLNSPPNSWKPSDDDLPASSRLVKVIIIALDFPEELGAPVAFNTMAVILQLALANRNFWKKLSESPDFAELIRCLLLLDPRKTIRSRAAQQIQEAVKKEMALADKLTLDLTDASARLSLTKYFWSALVTLVSSAANLPNQCEEVFRVTYFIVSLLSPGSHPLLDVPGLAIQTSELLLAHTCTEDVRHAERLDIVAKGLTSLLHRCLQLYRLLPLSPDLPENLAESLMRKHLYPEKRTQTEQPVPRVLLDEDTRSLLCDIVFQLVKHDKERIRSMLHELNGLVPFYVQEEDDPYLYELPYHLDRTKALRSPCGYVGLQNLSNTCYLNSLLTQLFMNSSFRQFMIGARIQDPGHTQQLLFYTQKLFGYMQETYRRFVDPTPFVGSIRAYDNTHIDISLQMDVDEFYNLLFDRWEGQLLSPHEKRKLRSFYGGQLVQQVKSKECDHISERLEPFSAIQCDIKGKSSLEESLQAYVDGEVLEGDNKYKCSTCDRHVDAVKRACLKDIPDNVIFHLKRFDFNLRTLARSKINDYFSFPTRVNLRPYTVEHLTQSTDEDEEDIFELVGILVHSGTAESGHYYSYIRERPASHKTFNWVEFNDDMVTPWDPATMENSTFGGPEHRPVYETNGIVYDKPYSAYMLFYQRSSSLRAEQELVRTRTSNPFPTDSMPGQLKEHIFDENTVILRRHTLFGPTHLNLVRSLFNEARLIVASKQTPVVGSSTLQRVSSGEREGDHFRTVAMHLALSHLDQVVSRAKDTPDFPAFAGMIREVLTDPRWAFQFYDYFNKRHAAFRSLLQRNPDHTIRLFISSAMALSLDVISINLPTLYDPPESSRVSPATEEDEDTFSQESRSITHQSVLKGAMALFDYLWSYFQINIKAWDEYFGLMLKFARLGRREVACLLSEDFLSRVIQIISADNAMELEPNYFRMLNNIHRRSTTRPPSYVAIIELTSYLMSRMAPVLGAGTIVEDPSERIDEDEDGFSWTSTEVRVVHEILQNQPGSIFVEKLLGLDQAHDEAENIIQMLTRLSSTMDVKVLRTLKCCIQGETSASSMDPFLRGAGAYLESTALVDNAKRIIDHIHNHVGILQDTEAIVFLDFMAKALHLHRSETEFRLTVHLHALGLIAKWAPYLLLSSERIIRSRTEDFLSSELYTLASSEPEVEGESEEVNNRDPMFGAQEALRNLGLQILMHLQDNYLDKRVQFEKDALATVLRVLERCASEYESDPANRSELEAEFFAMQSEVVGSVQGLAINEVDEDGSDWEGSGGTSDQADDVVEMNMQAVNEMNEMDMA